MRTQLICNPSTGLIGMIRIRKSVTILITALSATGLPTVSNKPKILVVCTHAGAPFAYMSSGTQFSGVRVVTDSYEQMHGVNALKELLC